MRTVGDVDPRAVIGAVFAADEAGQLVKHLGTGSIIGDGTIVLTANHVVDGYTLLRFVISVGNHWRAFPLSMLEGDWRRDLALLRIEGHRATEPLNVLLDAHVSYNHDLLTLEYAQTERAESGQWSLNPPYVEVIRRA